MSLLLARPLARLAGRAFALALAVGAIGLGALPAAAAPSALRVAAAPPKKAKPKLKSTSARRTVATRRVRTAVAKRPFARRSTKSLEVVTLPTLPPIVQLATADPMFQGAPAPAEAFAAMPVAAAPVSAGIDGRPLGGFGASAERLLTSMLDRARSQLGTRYVFGGNRPDQALDCSSFARFAMEALGITLPRTAQQQAQLGAAVPRDRAQLRPGDLLTFGRGAKVSHVGIYIGEGKFIHASVTSGRVIETTIERNTQLFRRWLGARRLIATSDTTATRRGG